MKNFLMIILATFIFGVSNAMEERYQNQDETSFRHYTLDDLRGNQCQSSLKLLSQPNQQKPNINPDHLALFGLQQGYTLRHLLERNRNFNMKVVKPGKAHKRLIAFEALYPYAFPDIQMIDAENDSVNNQQEQMDNQEIENMADSESDFEALYPYVKCDEGKQRPPINKRKRRFTELADSDNESDDDNRSLTDIHPYTYYSDEAAMQQQTGDLVVYGGSTNNANDNRQLLSYSIYRQSDEYNTGLNEVDIQALNLLSHRLTSLLPRSEIQNIISKFISFIQEIPEPEPFDSDSIDSDSIYVDTPPVIYDEPFELKLEEGTIPGSIKIEGVLRRVITKKFFKFEPCPAGIIRRVRTKTITKTYRRTFELIPRDNCGNYENARIEEIDEVDDDQNNDNDNNSSLSNID